MTEIANADRGMVQAVIDNLRAADAEEMAACGTDMDSLAHMLMRHSQFAFCAWDYDCGPISVWGAVLKRPGVCTAYAFGTDEWPRAVLPMVRQIRGFIMPYLVEAGVHRVDAVAMLKRNDVKRFMRLLGAKSEGVLTGYGTEGEAFVSYRWLSNEHGGYRAAETKADGAYTAH